MKPAPKIESGAELWARLSTRPSLRGLENRLFDEGPNERETVELCGNLSSGKTLLLTQLIAKCILPDNCDDIPIQGRGVAVVFINTDLHFRVSNLIKLMLAIVEKACRFESIAYSEEVVKHRVVLPAIENLVVVNCYDSSQFELTIKTLDNILMNNSKIGLVAVDSISSFYWQARESGGVWSIDQYLKNVLKTLQTHIFQNKIVMIYTRPLDFVSKGQNKFVEVADQPILEKINYRINLGNFCRIETAKGNREIHFKIGEKGITWPTENQELMEM